MADVRLYYTLQSIKHFWTVVLEKPVYDVTMGDPRHHAGYR